MTGIITKKKHYLLEFMAYFILLKRFSLPLLIHATGICRKHEMKQDFTSCNVW